MMDKDIQWLIGISAGLFTFLGGTIIAAFRSLTASREAGDNALHDRINRVRDEYVRRVDHDGQQSRTDDAIKELRDEMREGQRETNRRLDAVLAALAPGKRQ
ncbi:hypothetical protein ACTJJ7_15640 [Phyllobacterium sp. 22229]|uniref:hypothetical protein n=1 Tax=Phyllobacterium sp. 22229 TaxID=3453895 RepID=UPI003F87798D